MAPDYTLAQAADTGPSAAAVRVERPQLAARRGLSRSASLQLDPSRHPAPRESVGLAKPAQRRPALALRERQSLSPSPMVNSTPPSLMAAPGFFGSPIGSRCSWMPSRLT